MPVYDVKVLDAHQQGTGLIVVQVAAVQTVDNNTRQGPPKGYAIDPDTLAAHYGGDIQNWLNWVKQEHQRFHGLHESMAEGLAGLKGKLL